MLARVGGVFRSVRFRAAAIALAVVGCMAGAAVTTQAKAAGVDVLKVRLGGDRAETRIVIDLNKAATSKVSSDGSSDGRVVLTLPGVDVAGGLQGGAQGLVKTWVMDESGGGARLRIDLAADATVKRRFLLPPAEGVDHYRYVIDLAATGTPSVRPQGAPEIRLTSQVLPAKASPLNLKKVVVIDAGHGGRDPGAKGTHSHEKDLNLAAAKTLKARLERTGRYRVVMTRTSDVYVPLESRVQIARRADAELFISLHADSGPDASLRGASVYTLSDKAAARSVKFIRKDDWFMQANAPGGDRGVSDILLDLTQRATKNRSAAFAEVLLARIDDEVQLLRRSHREAGLVVLLAPDVPAVLLEMGFVNNAQDEAMLRDPTRRGRFMDSVARSIDDYFAQTTKLAAR